MPDSDFSEYLAREDLARAALAEIAPAGSIGALSTHSRDDSGVVSLQFECLMPGYPGWLWTAAMAKAHEAEAPTVLEVELLPGDGALIAPPWRPWAERFAEYQATHIDDAADHADEELDDEDSATESGEDSGDEDSSGIGTVDADSETAASGDQASEGDLADVTEPDPAVSSEERAPGAQ